MLPTDRVVWVVASRPYVGKIFNDMFYLDEEEAKKAKNEAENALFEGCCKVYKCTLIMEEVVNV